MAVRMGSYPAPERHPFEELVPSKTSILAEFAGIAGSAEVVQQKGGRSQLMPVYGDRPTGAGVVWPATSAATQRPQEPPQRPSSANGRYIRAMNGQEDYRARRDAPHVQHHPHAQLALSEADRQAAVKARFHTSLAHPWLAVDRNDGTIGRGAYQQVTRRNVALATVRRAVLCLR